MTELQAEHESAINRLRADMAQRKNRIMFAMIGAGTVVTAILGLMIQLSGSWPFPPFEAGSPENGARQY